ncbi:hypothetical protein CCR94_09510 [Rhodoblastus sphagnicola]|uniref:Ancillary SecYEG translocon subunit/Cell division coordinator CpoB TPR domain-containing protein n=1 Tax=Rhodoblastus sphagnicola TaxID=333368 RepID=A0A2S6N9T6_9HYPH|nr:tetratricopeptide repeat protein [Rhodoblastus sphagnicola]MBB4198194.1 hypothetical protein [Rhodoblastus sphagnicola]PPQ31369.1 hypothetical protein CCR94_09510 [Rhodoblastus sphagnicola]
MADIFREVDEDIRSDKLSRTWAKYSFLVYGAAVAVVAGTAGFTYLRHEKNAAAEAAGAKFAAAQELSVAGKSAEANEAFAALAKAAPEGVRALSLLRAAQELGLTDRAGAVKAFDALAADSAVPALLQDVARLRAGLLRVDDAEKAELENRFGPLLNGSFRFSARETLALAALKRGDLENAGRLLDQLIVDPNTPAAMRQRAEALASLARGGGKVTPPTPEKK